MAKADRGGEAYLSNAPSQSSWEGAFRSIIHAKDYQTYPLPHEVSPTQNRSISMRASFERNVPEMFKASTAK